MAKYGKSASKNVKSTMRRRKKGTLKSGSGRTVKSRKQAIAIGLNEARKKGAKYRANPQAPASAQQRNAECPGQWGRRTSGDYGITVRNHVTTS